MDSIFYAYLALAFFYAVGTAWLALYIRRLIKQRFAAAYRARDARQEWYGQGQ